MSKLKVVWIISGLALGIFWTVYGIAHMVSGTPIPSYIALVLGFLFICWAATDWISELAFRNYRDANKILREVINQQGEEIVKMQQRLRQWN